jgi:hypothetical protein
MMVRRPAHVRVNDRHAPEHAMTLVATTAVQREF